MAATSRRQPLLHACQGLLHGRSQPLHGRRQPSMATAVSTSSMAAARASSMAATPSPPMAAASPSMEGTSPPPMPWPATAVLLMAMNGKRHGDDAATEASEEVAACFPVFILTRGDDMTSLADVELELLQLVAKGLEIWSWSRWVTSIGALLLSYSLI